MTVGMSVASASQPQFSSAKWALSQSLPLRADLRKETTEGCSIGAPHLSDRNGDRELFRCSVGHLGNTVGLRASSQQNGSPSKN